MKKYSFLLLLCCSSLLCFGQIKEKAIIDSVFIEWDQSNTPGCALGIIQNGKLIYSRGYGLANMEYSIPNTDHSIFRIGSSSKQFTAACIILLAQQGKLELDNSLHSYFPNFPEYSKKITVRQLLNHTSGMRDYLTLARLKGYGDDDYYEDHNIMDWLVHQEDLNFEPGTEFLYCNSGYWLLGQIVNQVAGMNMADFAKKEIFEPLEMNHTHFHNNHTEIVRNRASGYIPINDDTYEISMTTLDMIGDGGIFTNIQDLKKWDDAYYNSSILNSEFWEMMTQRGSLSNGETLDYASGLFVDEYKGLKTISHGGAFVGFRADMMRFPEQNTSIIVLANRGDANPTKKIHQVADILLQDEFPDTPETSSNQERIPPSVVFSFDQIIGSYEVQPGVIISISQEKDSLKVTQEWNNAEYCIENVNGNTFQLPNNSELDFTFLTLEGNATQLLEVRQGKSITSCKRYESIDISGVDLNEYTGVYYSKELDINYSLIVKENTLLLKVRNREPIQVYPSGMDEFLCEGSVLRFLREKGTIVGYELDAGRVKNLTFTKQR